MGKKDHDEYSVMETDARRVKLLVECLHLAFEK